MAEIETMHFDGHCPFLTCLETGPHDHEICPTCRAVRYGNLYCNTCRQRMNEKYNWRLPMLNEQNTTEAGPLRIRQILKGPARYLMAQRLKESGFTIGLTRLRGHRHGLIIYEPPEAIEDATGERLHDLAL